jgi:EAL and modified HD-GYP domain-containing signal transduction protein
LKSQGYRIALDDFRYHDNLKPFLKLADFIKLDVIANSKDEIQRQLQALAEYPAAIIAEKVETPELYDLCKKLGFSYYQGFFFCKPQLLKRKHVPANRLVVLNLLGKLHNTDLDFDELEAILAQDVSLSYKLLRYINSAMFTLRREVDSIKDAVVLLGLNNVRQWLSLILMSKMVERKPDELIVTALVRGKMCELLAARIYPEIKSQMFIVGLFSILDALMDTPMIELLDTVILNADIKMALLDKIGKHGEIYKIVLDYEHFDLDQLMNGVLSSEELVDCYIEAVEWADSNIKALQETA